MLYAAPTMYAASWFAPKPLKRVFSKVAHRLHPAEDLLDALSEALADRAAWLRVIRASIAERPRLPVFSEVGRDVALTAVVDEVARVVAGTCTSGSPGPSGAPPSPRRGVLRPPMTISSGMPSGASATQVGRARDSRQPSPVLLWRSRQRLRREVCPFDQKRVPSARHQPSASVTYEASSDSSSSTTTPSETNRVRETWILFRPPRRSPPSAASAGLKGSAGYSPSTPEWPREST
jgi:hypothetical protein